MKPAEQTKKEVADLPQAVQEATGVALRVDKEGVHPVEVQADGLAVADSDTTLSAFYF